MSIIKLREVSADVLEKTSLKAGAAEFVPGRNSEKKPPDFCRFYNTPGGCFKGKECKYQHVHHTPVCRYFSSKLGCRSGSECYFKHEKPNESRSSFSSESNVSRHDIDTHDESKQEHVKHDHRQSRRDEEQPHKNSYSRRYDERGNEKHRDRYKHRLDNQLHDAYDRHSTHYQKQGYTKLEKPHYYDDNRYIYSHDSSNELWLLQQLSMPIAMPVLQCSHYYEEGNKPRLLSEEEMSFLNMLSSEKKLELRDSFRRDSERKDSHQKDADRRFDIKGEKRRKDEGIKSVDRKEKEKERRDEEVKDEKEPPTDIKNENKDHVSNNYNYVDKKNDHAPVSRQPMKTHDDKNNNTLVSSSSSAKDSNKSQLKGNPTAENKKKNSPVKKESTPLQKSISPVKKPTSSKNKTKSPPSKTLPANSKNTPNKRVSTSTATIDTKDPPEKPPESKRTPRKNKSLERKTSASISQREAHRQPEKNSSREVDFSSESEYVDEASYYSDYTDDGYSDGDMPEYTGKVRCGECGWEFADPERKVGGEALRQHYESQILELDSVHLKLFSREPLLARGGKCACIGCRRLICKSPLALVRHLVDRAKLPIKRAQDHQDQIDIVAVLFVARDLGAIGSRDMIRMLHEVTTSYEDSDHVLHMINSLEMKILLADSDDFDIHAGRQTSTNLWIK